MGSRRKAALTLEASWVFGISMLVIYSMLALSFHLYQETGRYIEQKEPQDIDVVKVFRLTEMGEDLLEDERGNEKN